MNNHESSMTLTDRIRLFNRGVVENPYQGTDKKVLFICSMGLLRSATGAAIYAQKYNTRCAGTLKEALIPLTQLLLDWCDECVFVNKENYNTACIDFPKETFTHKSRVLDISDTYNRMHPKLVKEFKTQYESLIEKKCDSLND